jgi:cytochrome c peroxidase
MHDGSIASLREVVAHYARGGRSREGKSSRVAGFSISSPETDDLVAFLESLTDEKFLTNPAFGDPR